MPKELVSTNAVVSFSVNKRHLHAFSIIDNRMNAALDKIEHK